MTLRRMSHTGSHQDEAPDARSGSWLLDTHVTGCRPCPPASCAPLPWVSGITSREQPALKSVSRVWFWGTKTKADGPGSISGFSGGCGGVGGRSREVLFSWPFFRVLEPLPFVWGRWACWWGAEVGWLPNPQLFPSNLDIQNPNFQLGRKGLRERKSFPSFRR